MKTAIYVRVSTEEQVKEGYSIEAQESRLKDFVRSQGWSIADLYIDEGRSAKDLDRPEMKRLIRDIKKGKIDVVLVYKLDRLVRSVINLHELLQLFDKHDVKFRSATELFDTTTAMGRFFITIVGAMAEWERENLAERVLVGMETKAEKGERNGGVAPYGYKSENGKLVKDQSEGTVLMRIIHMYRNNTGFASIAKKLNAEGVPFRDNKRKVISTLRGSSKWTYSTVYYILSNPVYCGKIRWGEQGSQLSEAIIVDSDHEAYITVEEFEGLQITRKSRGNGSIKLHTNFVFSSILRCGRCGHSMNGSSQEGVNGTRRRWYRCTGSRNYGVCDMPHIREEDVESAFLEDWGSTQIRNLHPQEDEQDNTAEASNRLKEIENELAEIKGRKKQWILAFGKKAITLEELQELNKDDNELETILKDEVTRIEVQQAQKNIIWSVDDLNHIKREIKLVWPNIKDVEAKKMFLNEIFESITISVEKERPRARKIKIEIIDFVPKKASNDA